MKSDHTPTISGTKTSVSSVMAYVIFAATGALMLVISWRKWPDILIDFGRELYTPWQIVSGAVLYKDIAYLNGPLSSYLNALMFKVFGTSLMTLALFNILLIALLTVIIYRIFLIISDSLTAAIAGVVFLTLFAFSQYVVTGNYNFVCPYSYDITHGIIMSFAALYVLFLYVKTRKLFWIATLGLLLGLIFLTKMEVFIAIGISVAFGLIAYFLIGKVSRGEIVKSLIAICVSAVLPSIAFIAFLSSHMPIGSAVRSLMTSYNAIHQLGVSSNMFYKIVMGTNEPVLNLARSLSSAAGYLAISAAIIFAGILISRISDRKVRTVVSAVTVLTPALLAYYLISGKMWLAYAARGLPIAMILLLAYAIFLMAKALKPSNSERRPQLILLFSVTLFALILLFKIFLNVQIGHYGFALAMPAALLFVMVFLYVIPESLGNRLGCVQFVRYAGLVLIALCVSAHVARSGQIYGLKSFPVAKGADTILTFRPNVFAEGVILDVAMSKIKEAVPEGKSLVVLPEGVMINYLLRVKNPTPYITFVPLEVMVFGEDRMVRAFGANPPDYIVMVERDVTEYGYKAFGIDYGARIYGWVVENYTPTIVVGSPPMSGKGFGIMLLKRRQKNLN